MVNKLLSAGTISNPTFKGSPLDGLQSSPTAFLVKFIPNAIGLCFVVASIIFLFMMLIGGIQWISSGGDKQGLEAARGKISNALIGMVILFATFAIISLIQTFFGIQILTIDIGPLVI